MNSFIKIFILAVFTVFLASGCKYDWIIPEEVPIIDPNDPNQQISFSEEILPIFLNGNNCTACHGGGQVPDLREDRAYTSINTTRYINKETPEESRIYAVPNPDTGNHYKQFTPTQAALVLAWIQQGAKNN